MKQQQQSDYSPIKPSSLWEELATRSSLQHDYKETVTVKFLNKLTQSDIDAIQHYIKENQMLFWPCPKRSFTLFEDLMIINQFRKVLPGLKERKIKVVNHICEKLEDAFKKSRVTIKQRMCKKIAYCNIQEIMLAIKEGSDLKFKQNCNQASLTLTKSSQNKKVRKIMIQELQICVMKGQMNSLQCSYTPNCQKNQQIITQSSVNSIYKYGKKPQPQRIYIYVKKDTKINFSSQNQIRNSLLSFYTFDVPNIIVDSLPNAQQSKMNLQGKDLEDLLFRQLFKLENQFEEVNKLPVSTQFRKVCKKLKNVVSSAKEIEVSPQSSQEPIQNQETCQPSSKKDKKNHKQPKGKSKNKKVSKEPNNNSLVKSNCKEEIKQKLEQAKNSKQDPELTGKNSWSKVQDSILKSFSTNSKAYRNEMRCLIGYKTVEDVLERFAFLNITIDRSLIEETVCNQEKRSNTSGDEEA